jgi:hypothetical protein
MGVGGLEGGRVGGGIVMRQWSVMEVKCNGETR